jgi:hypothetical protein
MTADEQMRHNPIEFRSSDAGWIETVAYEENIF